MSKKKIPRAGFIPFYLEDGEIYVMTMKPSDSRYGGDKFQLAKGKVESGETSQFAAEREASEELGLKRDNLKNSVYLGRFLGYTDVFYGEVIDKDDFGKTTYETKEARWMPLAEFLKVGRSIHIPIFRAFQREVSRNE